MISRADVAKSFVAWLVLTTLASVAWSADLTPADPASASDAAIASKSNFDTWTASASAVVRSPVKAMKGDLSERWRAPDGRVIEIVVQSPRVSKDGKIITLPPVPSDADARPYFEAALDQVRASKASTLEIPKGHYVFKTVDAGTDSHLSLTDLQDVTVVGNGATLSFTQNKAGITVARSRRLKISEMIIDYALRMASIGTIKDRNGEHVLEIDGGLPVVAADEARYLSEFDRVNRKWIPGGERVLYPPGSQLPVFHGDQTYTSDQFKRLTIGKSFVVFHQWYGGAAVQIRDQPGPSQAEDIILDHVRIDSAPGMGIVAYGLKRGLAVLHSRIMAVDEAATVPVSTEYDAIHILITGGDVLIRGNEIANQGDDGINLNSPVTPVTHAGDGQSLTLSTYSRFISPGDRLAFFKPDGSYLDTTKVASVTLIGGLENRIDLVERNDMVTDGMFVRDIDLIGGRVAVQDNVIRDCHCHGILVQLPNTLVERNRFSSTSANAVRILANLGAFKEGTGAINVVFRDNVVENSGIDQALPFPASAISVYGLAAGNRLSQVPMNTSIDITGNKVIDPRQGCITIASSSRIGVAGNICSYSQQTPTSVNKVSINILQSSGVTMEGNRRIGSGMGPLKIDESTARTSLIQPDY